VKDVIGAFDELGCRFGSARGSRGQWIVDRAGEANTPRLGSPTSLYHEGLQALTADDAVGVWRVASGRLPTTASCCALRPGARLSANCISTTSIRWPA